MKALMTDNSACSLEINMTPHKCPVCDGMGKTKKYRCGTCVGTGTIGFDENTGLTDRMTTSGKYIPLEQFVKFKDSLIYQNDFPFESIRLAENV